jgi:hypothetical protein
MHGRDLSQQGIVVEAFAFHPWDAVWLHGAIEELRDVVGIQTCRPFVDG